MKSIFGRARWFQRWMFSFCLVATVVAVAGVTHAAPPNVAIVRGDYYTIDLANMYFANGVNVSDITTYSAATLAPYSHVIHYGNSFTDMTALQTYVQNGGTLIAQPWFWTNNSPPASLQIFNSDGGTQFSGPYPGVTVLDAGSPLVAGISFPVPGGFNIGRTNGATFAAGVTPVANWTDGGGMIGTKALGAGKVIGINLHVITSDTAYQVINQPWATRLYLNAVGAVPEPASTTLLGIGALVAAGLSRRRTRA